MFTGFPSIHHVSRVTCHVSLTRNSTVLRSDSWAGVGSDRLLGLVRPGIVKQGRTVVGSRELAFKRKLKKLENNERPGVGTEIDQSKAKIA